MHTTHLARFQISLLELFCLVTVAGVITWAAMSIVKDYRKANDGPPIHWSSLWGGK